MLAEELHKPVIKSFKKGMFMQDFYAELHLDSRFSRNEIITFFFNRNVKYLLCVIDVFPKYAWVKPLKGKKAKTFLYAFIEIVN